MSLYNKEEGGKNFLCSGNYIVLKGKGRKELCIHLLPNSVVNFLELKDLNMNMGKYPE